MGRLWRRVDEFRRRAQPEHHAPEGCRFGSIDLVDYSKSAPEGEGYGYRLAFENAPDGRFVEPFVQWNTRRWIFTADGSYGMHGDPAPGSRLDIAAAGAIVLAGGQVALARPVPGSFGIVRVGEVEGVRVYRNQQEVGRTDASARLKR